jgi:hypothetical protein
MTTSETKEHEVTDAASMRRTLFVRNTYGGRDLELFMVVAFATIFTVRAALAATGWPQLGGGKIHFAHLLWGGLGMLVALILFMTVQGRFSRVLATVSAGVGFGLFIDELGKFVTSDNDYFFQPAIAFIYLTFVVLFVVGRTVTRTASGSPRSALVNAFDVAKEAVIRDLDESERETGLSMLAQCDPEDPVVRELTKMLVGMTARSKGRPALYVRARARLERAYRSLVARRWFRVLFIGGLVTGSIINILVAAGLALIVSFGSQEILRVDFWALGQIISATASSILVVIGAVRWRRSRVEAYRWFQRALLVTLFITEFFAFYQNQNTQFAGLVLTLLAYAAIRTMLSLEETKAQTTTR